jgi:TonB family protein
VQSSGFGDYSSAATRAPTRASTPTPSPATPVEILAKPTPVYTAEARARGIEGEVVVEVLFQASGQARVLRTLRGLGHGLDEAAVRAAEQIRFKPARRDGHAVDSSATVHIVFRLA